MFRNKNAGLIETLTRLNPSRRMAKPKKEALDVVIPVSRKSMDLFVFRETYFAVGSPVRWKL